MVPWSDLHRRRRAPHVAPDEGATTLGLPGRDPYLPALLLTAESTQRYLETLILSAPVIALSIWRFGFRKRGA